MTCPGGKCTVLLIIGEKKILKWWRRTRKNGNAIDLRETDCKKSEADRTGSGSGAILLFSIGGTEPLCFSSPLSVTGLHSLAKTSQYTFFSVTNA
jgi:hypothetical protein